MNDKVKLAVYVVLLGSSALFGALFYSEYNRFMAHGSQVANQDPVENLSSTKSTTLVSIPPRMMLYGAFFVMSTIPLGLLTGRELAHYLGERAVKVLFDEDGELMKTPEYELAEQEWANGNPLDAVRLMRNYLHEHPREQHVALRIAEIYEKDLKNYLAAALEYEEVLKQQLPPEQWGWTAIHLCNLYSSRLNQPQKAMALLQRIESDYGHTAAADKARKRLIREGMLTESPFDSPPVPQKKRDGPASDYASGSQDRKT